MKLSLNLNGCTAVVDTYGAELISYRDIANTEYIWNGDPAYWAGRNPILFPIVGGLKNGQVQIDGKTYEMGRHGFARHSEFEVLQSGEHFAVLRLCDNAETLAQYPYHFELLVRHELTDDGFATSFTVRAIDSTIQFCIGAHTGFMCPLHRNERFEDYSVVFEQVENLPCMALTPDGPVENTAIRLNHTDRLALDHTLFDNDALIFKGLRSRSVSLRHNTTGKGVKMNFSDFPLLALWSKPHSDAPYLCFEPWVGHAATAAESNDFAHKPYVVTLSAGESFSIGYTVSVL
ncbi:aldose 1-epimerase family protein [Hydrogenoanaerobacterium sp.]|uniref:aldose 1-epimerase family protein n=1 Tax=Hydrogenoanaerobacterium sp. TaxID=2953763 RepID=UPI00289A073D|nr:aldose 1-epimerase family protein [Hydrogenoanaerobacterium sp.]